MRRTHVTIATLAVIVTFALPACGSDGYSSSGTPASSSSAPEDIIVADSTVAAGLAKLPATIAAAITAIGTPEAKAKLDAIEAEWFSFEGTIREKDAALYLQIEDQLTPLQRQIEDGDVEAAKATAQSLNDLFAQYTSKYPA